MLVQNRHDRFRLFTQHDHALACEDLALGLGVSLPRSAHLAIALHDFPWDAHDREPHWFAAESKPHGFTDTPLRDRLVLYSAGVDRLESIDPECAAIVSSHYCAFARLQQFEGFQALEAARRERLRQVHGAQVERRSLRWLQYLDLVSLWICLTPPSCDQKRRPDWLTRSAIAETPDGTKLRWNWSGDQHIDLLGLEASPFELRIPYRDVHHDERITSSSTLRTRYRRAPRKTFGVRIRPQPTE